MTQEKNLTLRNDLAITPAELVENATIQAKLLMNIVEQTHCYQTISSKKYLQVEAWETIGAFNRVHAITKQTRPIIKEGEIIGYLADVELLKDGTIVGGASMPCFFTENACKGKEGDAKHKACMSAAQTFATSKAYRMNYSYVAILAGYQPTPAEEMTGDAVDDRPANLKHWCEKHKTKFFKRGNMPGYAHPVEGTKEWCNEPATEAEGKPVPEMPQDAVGQARQPFDKESSSNLPEEAVEPPSQESKIPVSQDEPVLNTGPIDPLWLQEQLRVLRSNQVKGWDEANLLLFMKKIYKVEGRTTMEIASRLARGPARHFQDRVLEALGQSK